MNNMMRNIRIEKVTLNIGAGKEQSKLDKGMKLLKHITGVPPVKTITNKRIAGWGLRPGLPIGCKITIRKNAAIKLLKRLLEAKEKKLNPGQFDDNGNLAFGITECIDIPGVKYDPEIGIFGLEVCVTLERPGYRIKKRRILKKKVPMTHRISKEDAINFMENGFEIKVNEKGDESE